MKKPPPITFYWSKQVRSQHRFRRREIEAAFCWVEHLHIQEWQDCWWPSLETINHTRLLESLRGFINVNGNPIIPPRDMSSWVGTWAFVSCFLRIYFPMLFLLLCCHEGHQEVGALLLLKAYLYTLQPHCSARFPRGTSLSPVNLTKYFRLHYIYQFFSSQKHMSVFSRQTEVLKARSTLLSQEGSIV